ncbi:transposase/IS protein [Cupriavidus basilensis OR16]|uniref:Transposase/IS protein n=1 Tax=Cupriavidus basilensis OR16 TaxID=1127483 RepID=H1S023_9BURK|nr:transposase/IS protein [Cupriavidus basilensis OR16]
MVTRPLLATPRSPRHCWIAYCITLTYVPISGDSEPLKEKRQAGMINRMPPPNPVSDDIKRKRIPKEPPPNHPMQ